MRQTSPLLTGPLRLDNLLDRAIHFYRRYFRLFGRQEDYDLSLQVQQMENAGLP